MAPLLPSDRCCMPLPLAAAPIPFSGRGGRRPLLSIPEAAITGDPLQIRLGLQAIQGRGCYGAGGAIFNADNPEWRLDVAGLQLKLSEYTKMMSNYNGVLAFPCF
ncbi:hypothetical protein BRADI_4g06936v3 [Brachypodium distachyon]|uniref:Uncharacterized protein n=1 Tax=Brachypodium distachyon TaxID=15368 RepID=A0A0Q3EG30_BRADI|nr:hypothetical protein BRADI_4g06936v3 [Brachypodium distachyon]